MELLTGGKLGELFVALAFGCGAGLTHLYIDGSGEVNPCNLVPISFGNLTQERLEPILEKMEKHFCKPRTRCVGQMLSRHIPDGRLPTSPQISARICKEHLPRNHAVPKFVKIQNETRERAGQEELRSAYDSIGQYYDEFWLVQAGKPTEELLAKVSFDGNDHILEAGCGTGFATALLAEKTKSGCVTAVDLSEEMLREAHATDLDKFLMTNVIGQDNLGGDICTAFSRRNVENVWQER